MFGLDNYGTELFNDCHASVLFLIAGVLQKRFRTHVEFISFSSMSDWVTRPAISENCSGQYYAVDGYSEDRPASIQSL
jgi:hypothetical protein